MIEEIFVGFSNFKNYPNRNKIIIFLVSSVVFFFVFLWSVFTLLSGGLTTTSNSVPNDGPGDNYNESVEKQIRENEPVERASYRVTEFINTLPYNGDLIHLSYSYETGDFELTYKTNDFNAGKSEFLKLLSENGITEKQIKKDLIEVYEEN